MNELLINGRHKTVKILFPEQCEKLIQCEIPKSLRSDISIIIHMPDDKETKIHNENNTMYNLS